MPVRGLRSHTLPGIHCMDPGDTSRAGDCFTTNHTSRALWFAKVINDGFTSSQSLSQRTLGYLGKWRCKYWLIGVEVFYLLGVCFITVEAREMLWEVAERTLSFKRGS